MSITRGQLAPSTLYVRLHAPPQMRSGIPATHQFDDHDLCLVLVTEELHTAYTLREGRANDMGKYATSMEGSNAPEPMRCCSPPTCAGQRDCQVQVVNLVRKCWNRQAPKPTSIRRVQRFDPLQAQVGGALYLASFLVSEPPVAPAPAFLGWPFLTRTSRQSRDRNALHHDGINRVVLARLHLGDGGRDFHPRRHTPKHRVL